MAGHTQPKRAPDGPERVPARTHLLGAAAVGIPVSIVIAFFTPWQVAILAGWDIMAAAYLVWVWWTLWRKPAMDTARAAREVDDSRAAADILLISASVASLVGVGLALLKASNEHGATRAWITAVTIATVALSWALVHTVYAVRYADLYYRNDGGITFPGDDEPAYRDFAYLAFTVGMTYQVSDTDLTSPEMRRTVLRHSLLSYLFGTAVIAMTINVVSSLLNH
jgi:uncharacterized membrane protein